MEDKIINQNEIKKELINAGSSVVGVIVGFAIGGPIGAFIGATTSPAINLTYNVLSNAICRRKERAESILLNAINKSKVSPNEMIEEISQDDKKTDDLISLLTLVNEIDPNFDNILSSILGERLKLESTVNSDLLFIYADAIKNMRGLHLKVIMEIYNNNGVLTPDEISDKTGISVIDLRSIVRLLELKGMILPEETPQLHWRLRELGKTIVEFAILKENNNENVS